MAGEPKTRRLLFGGRDSKTKPLFRWDNPVLLSVFFVFFTVAVVLLVNVNSGITPLQVTSEAVGEPALSDVKATRDFTFVKTDPEATNRKREEAAAAVPSVYDHNIELREQIIVYIRKAFADVRGPLREAESELLREAARTGDGAPSEEQAAGAGQGEDKPQDKEAAPSAKDEAPTRDKQAAAPGERGASERSPRKLVMSMEDLQRWRVNAAEGMRDNFNLALKIAVISDESYEVLSRSAFDRQVEEALVSLVNPLMQRRVVADRRLLEVEGKGILLRRLNEGKVQRTLKIYDIDESFLSLSDLPRELGILAPGRLQNIDDPDLRQTIRELAVELITPNTRYNHGVTEDMRQAAWDSVQDLGEKESFRKGQIIVSGGDLITTRHVEIILEMEGASDARVVRSQMLLGTLVMLLALLGLLYLFSHRNISKFRPASRDLVLMASMLLLQLGLLQGLVIALERVGERWTVATPEMVYFGIPLAFGAMIVRLTNNSETAMIHAVLSALLAGLAVDQSLSFGLFVLMTSLMGAHSVGQACHRMDVLRASLQVGGVGAVMALALFLLDGAALTMTCLGGVIAGFLGGLAAGLLVNTTLPLAEVVFSYTTNIKLVELGDMNHPAIKELILKAPGTYHHSVVVGTLAKEAAEAINANPLLARVGANYHDIGKMKTPQYFAENQRSGHNPHDKLKPNMSALIIKSHVKDGLELARQYSLPREIQDFIAMHHGTTLIAYFYHKAKSMEDPDIPEVDEEDYRYPGPKPQTRETAIVMLADGIEAASRAMPEPTEARIKGLVQKMINAHFADGQLDECNLTLKDLNAIAKAFIRVLTSMYYTRPQYPGNEKNPGARAAQKRKDSASGEFKRSDVTQTGERKRRRAKEKLQKSKGADSDAAGAPKGAGQNAASSTTRQTALEAPEKVSAGAFDVAVALPEGLDFQALPPMDLTPSQRSVRITGPLPPMDHVIASIKAELEAERAVEQETVVEGAQARRAERSGEAHDTEETPRSAASLLELVGGAQGATGQGQGLKVDDKRSAADADEQNADAEEVKAWGHATPAPQEERHDHGSDSDAQSTTEGDQVVDEGGHSAAEQADPPALRRLGLS